MVLESSPDLWRMWQELLYASWFGDLMTDSFSLAAAQQKVSAEARAEKEQSNHNTPRNSIPETTVPQNLDQDQQTVEQIYSTGHQSVEFFGQTHTHRSCLSA